jgi:hypothetical protein
VAVYALAPPAAAERLLAVERRLREKARVAGRAVGVVGTILPKLPGAADPLRRTSRSAPELEESIRAILARWTAAVGTMGSTPGPLVAGVRAPVSGFLAACSEGGVAFLVAACGGAPTREPEAVARAVQLADGAPAAVGPARRDGALAAFDRWRAAHRAAVDAGLDVGPTAAARRAVIDRIASVVRRAAPHRRPAVAALAGRARRAALLPCGAGGELVLDELARAEMADEAWLRTVAAFGELHAARCAEDGAIELEALIVFHP